MSLAKINYEYSKMIGGLISLQFDPYDRTCMLTSEMDVYVLEKVLTKMNRLLLTKILSHHYQIPFSEITYLHTVYPDNHLEYMVEDLSDERCTTAMNMGGVLGMGFTFQ